MSATIYHNPRCSKSRQTLALLEARVLELEVIEYLRTPPDADTLERILDMLDLAPRALMRKQESAYAEQGLDDESLSDGALVRAMIANPILIERPIVVTGGRAAIGRPPERVLEIL